MKSYLISLIICVLIFSSCGEDAFSTTIEVEIPSQEDRLVLHLMAEVGQDSIVALLTKTVKINEAPSDPSAFVEEATITLEGSDGSVYIFENERDINLFHNYELKGQDIIKPGHSYMVTVEKEGFETITAFQEVPPKPMAQDAIFTFDGGINLDGETRHSVDIIVEDQLDFKNYYEFTLLEKLEELGGVFSTRPLESTDPSLLESFSYQNLIASDILFDGEAKKIKLLTRFLEVGFVEFKIRLHAITKAQYEFSRTARRADDEEDNPFSTPVQVYSNMSNGVGIFAIAHGIDVPITE